MIKVLSMENFTEPLPGFYDYISPDTGQSGLRLLVQDEESLLSPDTEGLDIADGVAAIVGIKAKQILHLPPPYTDCSTEDKEEIKLEESIHQMLGNSYDDKRDPGITKAKTTSYRTASCR